MISYYPNLGNLTATDKPYVPGAMGITVSFSDAPTKESQASQYDQRLPYTYTDDAIPDWVASLDDLPNETRPVSHCCVDRLSMPTHNHPLALD